MAIALITVGCSNEGGSSKRDQPAASTPTASAEMTKEAEHSEESSGEATETAGETPGLSQDDLVARGKGVYMANCIACHNSNPAKDGTLGPAVAGSSHALIEDRVVSGTYPEGYEPKRTSKLMIPLPHLAPDIDALTAYLDSVE